MERSSVQGLVLGARARCESEEREGVSGKLGNGLLCQRWREKERERERERREKEREREERKRDVTHS